MDKILIPPRLPNQPAGHNVKVADRRLLGMNLRRQGMSFVKIGKTLGISDKTAAADVKHCLTKLCALTKATTEEYRALELEKIDSLYAGLIKKAENGDLWSVDRAINLITLRCRILGLEIPAALIIAGDKERPILVEHDIDAQLLARMRRLAGLDSDEKIIDVTPEALPTPPVKQNK